MNQSWYQKIEHDHPDMVRVDFRIDSTNAFQDISNDIAYGMGEYFKSQRLDPQWIIEWDECLAAKKTIDAMLAQKIKLAFAEGVLKDDFQTVDEDAFLGTCGQLLFMWVRKEFYKNEIIDALPRQLTDSSKRQGIDYFEILGNPGDAASLYFIVWEVKATDGDVTSRTDEIYRMHTRRIPRLLRGLQSELSFKYPTSTYPVLGNFVQHLLDHWLSNTQAKRIGGAVIFDSLNQPGDVFTTFSSRFSELHSRACRQVILIEVPNFRETRKKLWSHLLAQMS